jgi:hypothetical protein
MRSSDAIFRVQSKGDLATGYSGYRLVRRSVPWLSARAGVGKENRTGQGRGQALPNAGDRLPQCTNRDAGSVCGITSQDLTDGRVWYPISCDILTRISACVSPRNPHLQCSMRYIHENHLHVQQPRDALCITRRVCNPPAGRHHEVSEFALHCDWIRLIKIV